MPGRPPAAATLLALALALLTGCSPFQRAPWGPDQPGLHLVEAVPFRAQERVDDCGPAALASLLAHRGVEVPVAEIRARVYQPKLGGSLLPDVENHARALGFATRSGRGTPELLREQVDRGRPVMIPVETGFSVASRPHYLVVFGYDADRFLVHAGVREGVFVEADDLDRRWARMGRLFLVLE